MAVINSSTLEEIDKSELFVNENETHSHIYIIGYSYNSIVRKYFKFKKD